ncbi:uncharacterized protein LOC141614572 [Silene latifolia]|uniref:uncharacterized protein LOC141614572 n=1 Tax=Silene latifolia TaxID=37657 RepID=UPI003D76FC27
MHSYVRNLANDRKFWFTLVYGFNKKEKREELWKTLKGYNDTCNEAWAVGGDFNNVLHFNERIGSDVTATEIQPFQNCVDYCQLHDIQAFGPFFIWNNKYKVDTRVYSRIDIFMVNMDWMSIFPDAYANYMREGLLDHCPFVVQFGKDEQRRKSSFKYYNMWFLSPEFTTIISTKWNEMIDGTLMFQVVSKLK